MGIVYEATHVMLRRPTALKLLPIEKAGRETVSRFEREVRQTSRLEHPNSVYIFDYGRTPEGQFYYAMEYLDGFDLKDLVAHEGPLGEARTSLVLRQAARALAEAHAMGLVHRDIKPSNIMLCSRGQVPDTVKVGLRAAPQGPASAAVELPRGAGGPGA
jgi:serine/threonine-protein kinase